MGCGAVRARVRALASAVLVAAGLNAGCGSTAPSGPAAPSAAAPQAPIIAGDWTQTGTRVALRFPTGDVISYGCADVALIIQQTGASFSGRGYVNGFGNAAAYCRHNFSLTGTIAGDGTVTRVRLDPPFPAERCTSVASDGLFSGTATPVIFRVRMTDRWICPNFVGTPTEVDRTVELALGRPPAPAPPPGPAPPPIQGFPSLVGEWRAAGSVSFVDAQTAGSLTAYSCEGSWSVRSQTGNEFSGSAGLKGNGWSSDRYCLHTGSVTGRVSADGALSDVRGQPVFSNRCTDLSNDGTMTGLINPDGTTVKLETTARGMCLDDVDRRREVTRTVTILLTRR